MVLTSTWGSTMSERQTLAMSSVRSESLLCFMQISANGKTTSLGDHDTEEEAARAFDRAAINKDGCRARTNFPVDQYETEIDDLQSKWPPSMSRISHRVTRGAACYPSCCVHPATMIMPGHAPVNGPFCKELVMSPAIPRSRIRFT